MIEKLKNNKKYVIVAILFILSIAGFSYVFYKEFFGSPAYSVLITFLLAAHLFYMIGTFKVYDSSISAPNFRKISVYSCVFSYVFSVFCVMGAQLKSDQMTAGGVKGKLFILLISGSLACFNFPYFFRLLLFVDKKTDSLSGRDLKSDELSKRSIWDSPSKLFFISSGIIFLMYIPVFLAYYPAIMAHDFHRQSQEAIQGLAFFWPYQPLAHTWLYWLFFKIGNAAGSLVIGMALYTLFQILLISASFGYMLLNVYRISKEKWLYFCGIALLSIHPLFSVMSVEATKDGIFTASFVFFVSKFLELELFDDSAKKRNILNVFILTVTAVVMSLFRYNAIYALSVFFLFWIPLGNRKHKISYRIILSLAVLSVSFYCSSNIASWIGTSLKGVDLEKYNAITQSVGRVGYLHADEMDDSSRELLESIIPNGLWKNYGPSIGDGVRWNIDDEYWAGRKKEIFADWIKLGLRYPNEYIDSFLLTNAGYLFFDDQTWCEVFGRSAEYKKGALSTNYASESAVIPGGIPHTSFLPGLERMLDRICCGNEFYNWPIVSILFRPAFYVWFMILSITLFLLYKKKNRVMALLFPMLYLLTVMLGPVVQWRYIYPIAALFPLILGIILSKDNNC